MVWYEELKSGDKVIVSSMWNGDRVEVVDKVTPSGHVKLIGTSTKYKNGRQMGASRYGVPYLEEWSQEKEDTIKRGVVRRLMVNALKDFEFSDMSDEDLSRCHILSKKYMKVE
jgi:hypothetical protein